MAQNRFHAALPGRRKEFPIEIQSYQAAPAADFPELVIGSGFGGEGTLSGNWSGWPLTAPALLPLFPKTTGRWRGTRPAESPNAPFPFKTCCPKGVSPPGSMAPPPISLARFMLGYHLYTARRQLFQHLQATFQNRAALYSQNRANPAIFRDFFQILLALAKGKKVGMIPRFLLQTIRRQPESL